MGRQSTMRTRLQAVPSQIVLLSLVFCGFMGFNYVSGSGPFRAEHDHRRLGQCFGEKVVSNETTNPTTLVYPVDWNGGGVVLYILGVLYMFLALAIVCDEFFVPALEELSDFAGVSDDVSGATFMAAGGSAPELFTSTIGTFSSPPSAVGFGTIVGSAVFNVLFVIGMCAVCSKELLSLTWWPLARDCSYYIFSLFVLAELFKSGPNKIEIWEALVLLLMYAGYVTVMKFNQVIRTKIMSLVNKTKKVAPKYQADPANSSMKSISPFLSPATFRAGVLSLMIKDSSAVERYTKLVIGQIKGDARKTFNRIDQDGSGYIEKSELSKIFNDLGIENATEEDIGAALGDMDTSADSKISFEEFDKWYSQSKVKISEEVRRVFDSIDEEKNGCIEKHNIAHLMKQFGHTEINLDEIWESSTGDKDAANLTYDQFKAWYEGSSYIEVHNTDEEPEPEPVDLSWPDTLKQQIFYVIAAPLMFSMAFTIPDVRAAKWKKWFPLSFLMSIVWIGVFSFFMVEWATLIGDFAGIPSVVMGLTFLAAGTSIPDLLTSVIVARQGLGDMAVSSSIGSNIFDVLVGLPLPWLFYNIIKGEAIEVKAKTLYFSIIVLLLMVAAVICTIALSGWKLSKQLGITMFCLYVVYIIIALCVEYEVVCVNI